MNIITLAKKPHPGLSTTATILEKGTGAINIDGCRIKVEGEDLSSLKAFGDLPSHKYGDDEKGFHRPWMADKDKIREIQEVAIEKLKEMGRWPGNIVHNGKEAILDMFPDTGKSTGGRAYQNTNDMYSGGYSADVGLSIDPGYGNSGSASRFFFNAEEKNMIKDTGVPQELLDYLRTLITPPKGTDPNVLLIFPGGKIGDYSHKSLDMMDWTSYEDEEFDAVLVYGDLSYNSGKEHAKELFRVMKPGAHLISFPIDEVPSNWKNACALEDEGFEIRDSVAWVQEEGDLFYVSKASVSEKNAGCENITPQKRDNTRKDGLPGGDNPRNRGANPKNNYHPTVKPLKLGRMLAELLPEKTTILDPFMGSGSLPISFIQVGHSAIGFEREEEYLQIADARSRHWVSTDITMADVKIDSELNSRKEEEEEEEDAVNFWELF
jgi:DNA modification methylase